MPDTIRPLYSAPMMEPPSFALTKKVPMMEAMIETPPRSSGKATQGLSGPNTDLASSIAATSVTV